MSLFIKSGGVTLSGGEPLLQAEFAARILKGCKDNGIHTAIDTSGAVPLEQCKIVVDTADLVLLDIKSIDNIKCRQLTGLGNENALRLLEYLEKNKKEVWIRHVIVPGITDNFNDIEKMARYLSRFSVVSRVEVLPFHKMGEFKWNNMEMHYKLHKISVPSCEVIQTIKEIFKNQGLNLG